MNIPKPAQYILNFLLGYVYTVLCMIVLLLISSILIALFGITQDQPFTGLSFVGSFGFLIFTIAHKSNFFITK